MEKKLQGGFVVTGVVTMEKNDLSTKVKTELFGKKMSSINLKEHLAC